MHFDPVALSVEEDPYPFFRQLRDEAPVLHSESNDLWVVSRYEDVRNVLRSPQDFASGLGTVPDGFTPSKPMMIVEDPPYHTRLRAAVHDRFTPRRARVYGAFIERIVGELLDAIDGSKETDLIRAFTDPLPVAVVTELLGIGFEDRDEFKHHAGRMIHPGDRGHQEVADAQAWIFDYVERHLPAEGDTRHDDLIHALVTPGEGEQRLTRDEILGFCSLLLTAGTETTTNAFSSIVLILDRERALRRRLIEQPEALPRAIEECLRFESPVPGLSRVTTRDVELAGTRLPKGSRVHMLFASANRDERVFDDADRVCPDRDPNPHLAFGLGIHFCLGASIARLELRLAIEALVDRFPDYSLSLDGAERLASEVARGFSKLPFLGQPPSSPPAG
jgi:cytochrome P450